MEQEGGNEVGNTQLDLINKIPVLAKEFLISLQLLLFHQDLLCCGFLLNKHGWSAHAWRVCIKWGAQEQIFPCHLRSAAFFLGAASTISARSSAANAADTTLSGHLNPNPQHFLLFSSYFKEPYKSSFLLCYICGCTSLSVAQFCWRTCHIPCCSALASLRSGSVRFDLWLECRFCRYL